MVRFRISERRSRELFARRGVAARACGTAGLSRLWKGIAGAASHAASTLAIDAMH
jgi:hypothetical protein